jgi:NADH-quinone oxidoreductase subunit J
MLPRGAASSDRTPRLVGGVLCAISLVMLLVVPVRGTPVFRSMPTLEENLLFYTLAIGSLASGLMMITSRNPVYSALWFALVLLCNSALYLAQGAEFLSAATVIIYAGAIIVTFLFVIMLAQARGTASYDRVSREPGFAAAAGVLLASSLVVTIHLTLIRQAEQTAANPESVRAMKAPEKQLRISNQPGTHVAELGRTLFVDHYVSIQLVGLLLLAAVVGALLITRHRLDVKSPGHVVVARRV